MKHEKMNPRTRRQFRETIRVFFWRKAVMPCYYKCPHEYVVRQRDLIVRGAPWRITDTEWQYLKRLIDKHGEQVKWRHRRDVVMFEGRYVYWRCGPIINRTYRMSYLNGGRPSAKVLAKLRKRFWPNKADR